MLGQGRPRHGGDSFESRGGARGTRQPPKESHTFDNTRLCRFYTKGMCKRGDACTFAHGVEHLQPRPDFYRTQWCYDYIKNGVCQAGGDCRFAHCEEDLRPASVHKGQAEEACQGGEAEGAWLAQEGYPTDAEGNLIWSALEVQPGCLTGWQSTDGSEGWALAEAVQVAKESWHPAFDFSHESRFGSEGSTAELSRQTSLGSDLEDSSATSVQGISDEELRLGAAAGVALFVRNTFIDATPLGSAAAQLQHKRAKSVPAARHCPGSCGE